MGKMDMKSELSAHFFKLIKERERAKVHESQAE